MEAEREYTQSQSDTDVGRHHQVLGEAAAIFKKKNSLRGDMWRQFPPSDKLRELRERVTRMEALLARLDSQDLQDIDRHIVVEALIEEGLDSINFNVFFVRQIREGARG